MKAPHVMLLAFADDNRLRESLPGRSVPKIPPRAHQPLDPRWTSPFVGGMPADYGILVVNPDIASASSLVDPMQSKWKVR